MKAKTHSGAKKRIKIGKRKAGGEREFYTDKSCRNHLLQNKSKGQKSMGKTKIKISASKKSAVRSLLSL